MPIKSVIGNFAPGAFMTFYRFFMSVRKSHPTVDFFTVYRWSRRAYAIFKCSSFKVNERKCLRDYLQGIRSHRMMTGQRDWLNWHLYGINHGVY